MLSKDIFHVILTTNNNEEGNKFEIVFLFIFIYSFCIFTIDIDYLILIMLTNIFVIHVLIRTIKQFSASQNIDFRY